MIRSATYRSLLWCLVATALVVVFFGFPNVGWAQEAGDAAPVKADGTHVLMWLIDRRFAEKPKAQYDG